MSEPAIYKLLSDLSENGEQCSWDWEADLRFARITGQDTSPIEAAIYSSAPIAFRVAASRGWEKVTQKRIRLLRKLCKIGLANSYWSGTGNGGKSDFGLNRVKNYVITKDGQLFAREEPAKAQGVQS